MSVCGPTGFNHLPFANLLDKLNNVLQGKMSACHCECTAYNSPENMREVQCLSAHVHHHAVGLPKPHRVIPKFFGVSGRAFRSEEKKKTFTILFTMSLNCSTLPLVPILPLPVGVLLRGSDVSVSTNMFSVPFFRFLQIGVWVLGGGNGACSTCCRLLPEVRV